ncbi:hypothetical protein OSTOST_15255 [Ostertagia ostertagi]
MERTLRIIEVSDNSALITSLAGDAEPLKVQFDLLKRVPMGIDNETSRRRASAGRSAASLPCVYVQHLPRQESDRSANTALRNAQGKRIIHPMLFPAFPGYYIGSYCAQAVERLDQIPRE